ncbi:MAG: hypothetical protein E6K66_00905 [Nitrospirae bacterium]|nr:MAG: hypothetical protein E6K66_00905 [Nitrospirota bacterium]
MPLVIATKLLDIGPSPHLYTGRGQCSELLAVYGYPGEREFRPEYGLFTHVTPISGQRTISRMPMTQPRPNVLTVWKNPVVR